VSINIINGLLATTALSVAGVWVAIIPPAISQLNGVPTNIVGVVGTASYGPVNVPVACSQYNDFSLAFGPAIARLNDLGTAITVMNQQGANAFYVVRTTDTTDVAASLKFGVVSTNQAMTLTAKYTGSAANNFSMTIASSAIAASNKIIITTNLGAPEVFDGIPNTTPAAFWAAAVAAINVGTGALRGPSAYAVATIGTLTSTAIPTVGTAGATKTMTGGTDGAGSITDTMLLGTDGVGSARTGMYALRGTGCSMFTLADCVTLTTWPTQLAYALSEQSYAICASAAGDNIASAVTNKLAAGVDSYALKVMFGDWPTWLDTVNNTLRLVSPATFATGRLANLPPQMGTLNQQIFGIVATQATSTARVYSNLDIQNLVNAGIDVITNPSAGGQNFFACATGHNASSNFAVHNDSYTRMTNYLAATIAGGGMGTFIGQPITQKLLRDEKAVLDNSFFAMKAAGMISAYRNTVTSTPTQMQNGVTVITSQVQYLAINEVLVVQLQGGQTVNIQRQSGGPGK